ncbi:MAG: cation diffusion facilitator family transporter [Candidatus Kapaibacterium sp.]
MTDKNNNLRFTVVWISIVSNLLLFVLKYWAGIQSDSVAMTADAWHSLSDTLTSIVVLLGFYIADKPADWNHPYGHGRAESIASIIVATVLAIVGFQFIVDSVEMLYSGETAKYGPFAVIIFSVSVFVKEILAQISIRLGKKIKSDSLIADGWHHRSDTIASGLIVIGALIGSKYQWLDPLLGLFVSVLILYATFQIFKQSINAVLGTEPGLELIEKIRAIAKEVNPAITDVHNYKLHVYGSHKEMSLDIRLPADISVEDAHYIADALEMTVRYKLRIMLSVHIEPGLRSDDLYHSNYI